MLSSRRLRAPALLPLTLVATLSACGPSSIPTSRLESAHRAAGTRVGAKGTTIAASGTDWFNDAGSDAGANIDAVYARHPLPAAAPIVVAVIDSGVDIAHEDLKGHIWTNAGEIPGDGIDNDHNGYVDDVHGWNYLVDRNGRDVGGETVELTREFARLYKPYLASRNGTGPALSAADMKKLQALYADFLPKLNAAAPGSDEAKYYYNWQFDDQRADDLADFTPLTGATGAAHRYGNGAVTGPDASHGTHVSGIIAAVRGNGLGIDGIAANVRIMALRAVPNGDEHDKDIANAIRYAADNGARVVNMSFGKSYSRFPDKVLEAMDYAAGKGILFVHAAGNDAKNVDATANFPARKSGTARLAAQWLEVGAATDLGGLKLPADFSNFGAAGVDLFAPGYEIKSTTPGNAYESMSGTSMASPVVAGIAALVLSYAPAMSATEVKTALLATVHDLRAQKVYRPGGQTRVNFSVLSRTGGVVDAAAAVDRVLAARHELGE